MKHHLNTRKTMLLTRQLLRIYYSIKQEKRQITTMNIKKENHPIRKKSLTRYYLGKNNTGIFLSQREAECVVLFLEDYNDAQAAAVLGITERTVEHYVQKIKAKLGCHHKRQIIPVIKASAFMEYVADIKSTLTL